MASTRTGDSSSAREELQVLLLGERLCELALQGVDSLLIGRYESMCGGGHGQGADDEHDTEASQHVRPAVVRARRHTAAIDDVEPGAGRTRVSRPRRRRLPGRQSPGSRRDRTRRAGHQPALFKRRSTRRAALHLPHVGSERSQPRRGDERHA